MDLKGKTALVTGGNTGIGKTIVSAFAREGANVAIHYFEQEPSAQQLKSQLREMGLRAEIYFCDITSPRDVEQMAQRAISDFGEINILVNNAGLVHRAKFLDETYEDWKRTLDVNLGGTRNCSLSILKHMTQKGGGRIVNMSSYFALTGTELGRVAYTAAKAGIIGFTKSLAREFADRNVLVNCVAPGVVNTTMATMGRTMEELEAQKMTIPLKRLAEPEEIADAVVFAAKHDYMTGVVLTICGGVYI